MMAREEEWLIDLWEESSLVILLHLIRGEIHFSNFHEMNEKMPSIGTIGPSGAPLFLISGQIMQKITVATAVKRAEYPTAVRGSVPKESARNRVRWIRE